MPSRIACRLAFDRLRTIERYFSATARSSGRTIFHQRRMDSCTSASFFSPSTRASINLYIFDLTARYEIEVSWFMSLPCPAISKSCASSIFNKTLRFAFRKFRILGGGGASVYGNRYELG